MKRTASEKTQAHINKVLAAGGRRIRILAAKDDAAVFDQLKFKGYAPSIQAVAIKAARAALTGDDTLEAAARMVDHILKEGGGTFGDAIRALRPRP